jgi:hypothetical protein
MYSGTEGVYTHTVKYERDPSDPMCGAGVAVPVHADMTLQQVWAPILSTCPFCFISIHYSPHAMYQLFYCLVRTHDTAVNLC